MNPDAKYLIQTLKLRQHPEGGYYRETYRSSENLETKARGIRSVSTAIYYLLEGNQSSVFHRLAFDETLHFYDGCPLWVYVIDSEENLFRYKLCRPRERNGQCQMTIRAGHWFAFALDQADAYALIGCTVAPGFDFKDFEVAARNQLLSDAPQHKAVIEKYTKV